MQYDAVTTHVDISQCEKRTYRHWSPESELYAPADVLLQYLRQGWKLDKLVAVETVYYSGCRRSDIFYFTLQCGEATVEMPVLANPVVFYLIEAQGLTLLRINVERDELLGNECAAR
jgi:hypothetical protein